MRSTLCTPVLFKDIELKLSSIFYTHINHTVKWYLVKVSCRSLGNGQIWSSLNIVDYLFVLLLTSALFTPIWCKNLAGAYTSFDQGLKSCLFKVSYRSIFDSGTLLRIVFCFNFFFPIPSKVILSIIREFSNCQHNL